MVDFSSTPPTETEAAAWARYAAAAHGMQTGVAMKLHADPTDTTPKHLRVGINSEMVNDAALVGLLIKKGVLTMAEYASACADAMERERDLYAAELQKQVNVPVSLF